MHVGRRTTRAAAANPGCFFFITRRRCVAAESVFLFEGCIIKISPERLLEVSRVIIGFRDQILNPVRLCRGHWKNSIYYYFNLGRLAPRGAAQYRPSNR